MNKPLNREQRRKVAKQQTPQNVEKLARMEAEAHFNRQLHSIVAQATKKTVLLAMYALNNEYGFGHVRMQRFLERFNLDAMCIEDGENGIEGQPTLKEIEAYLEKEVGIKVN